MEALFGFMGAGLFVLTHSLVYIFRVRDMEGERHRDRAREGEREKERESNTERTMKRSNSHTETKKLNATGRRCVRTDAHGVFGFLSHPRRAAHLRWFFDVTLLKRRRVPTVNPKPHVRLCL